jgi:hypothetical protein
MRKGNWLKRSRVGFLVLGPGGILVGCRPSPDIETLRAEILDLHQKTIDAHWQKDAGFFAEHMAEGYFAVRNGEIQQPSREEVTAEYERHLGSTTFKEYRDLRQPIMRYEAFFKIMAPLTARVGCMHTAL